MNHSGRILAIATLTVRNAVRTRVFASMSALVVLTAGALPMVIKGDGTIEGYSQIALDYSLRLLTLVLAATSVWAAAGASSLEIADKQIHLLVTKPVAPFHIWLGKWFGLLAMNAVLLLLSGICVCAVLRWNLRPSTLTPEQRQVVSDEVLSARRAVAPEPTRPGQKINRRMDEPMATTKAGEMSQESIRETAGREIVRDENTVQPGASKTWTFRIGDRAGYSGPVFVHFQMSSPRQLELKPVAVEWRVYCPTDADAVSTYAAEVFAGRPNSFSVPSPGNADTLTTEFVNAQTNPPSTVVFGRIRGVTILVPHGSFEANLARSLIMIFCTLAVLSALGLTTGCLFSVPVAVFVSCATIAVFILGGMTNAVSKARNTDSARSSRENSALDSLATLGRKTADVVFAPISRYDPVERLRRGELVPWSLVGEAFAAQVLVCSVAFGIVGVLALRRRELGIPAD